MLKSVQFFKACPECDLVTEPAASHTRTKTGCRPKSVMHSSLSPIYSHIAASFKLDRGHPGNHKHSEGGAATSAEVPAIWNKIKDLFCICIGTWCETFRNKLPRLSQAPEAPL